MRRIPLEHFDLAEALEPSRERHIGLLTGWVLGLRSAQARRVLDRLLRDDEALQRAMPGVFDERERPARCAQLLLERAARTLRLSVGELASLLEDPERDTLAALALLARRGR